MVSMRTDFLERRVVHEIIEPNIADIDRGAPSEVVSSGFLILMGGVVGNLYPPSSIRWSEAHDSTPMRPRCVSAFRAGLDVGDAALR